MFETPASNESRIILFCLLNVTVAMQRINHVLRINIKITSMLIENRFTGWYLDCCIIENDIRSLLFLSLTTKASLYFFLKKCIVLILVNTKSTVLGTQNLGLNTSFKP
mmetsp:Transcript_11476/g.16831  ORF Transcript_11476/g.16831 Transcript_11476/m.16831 type:complete len:108 (-) Transcript_11476:996-1319(-)